MKKPFWIWRRQIAADQADAWFDQLAWIDPQRIMVFIRAGASRGRLEVYGTDAAELRRLLREHGGQKHRLLKRHLLPPAPAKPIRVQATLFVVGDRKTATQVRRKNPRARVLVIPASMAFGSGEHATTGMILRQLGRLGPRLESDRVLDLGTGSGILALTARALGARNVSAMDNCPDCIRISRDNEAANFSKRLVQWSCRELDAFSSRERYSLVTANLFSDLLIAEARRIWRLVAPGGTLLLSGILRLQGDAVARAYFREGAQLASHRLRGKWVMLEFSRVAKNVRAV